MEYPFVYTPDLHTCIIYHVLRNPEGIQWWSKGLHLPVRVGGNIVQLRLLQRERQMAVKYSGSIR